MTVQTDAMDCLPAARGEGSALETAETLYKTPALVFHRVRCGKPACRCATAEGHGPFAFLYWREAGTQRRRYVRRAEVDAVRAAVEQRRHERAADRIALADGLALLRQLETLRRDLDAALAAEGGDR